MRYYPSLPTINTSGLYKLPCETVHEKTIFGQNGFYKYENERLIKYKMEPSTHHDTDILHDIPIFACNYNIQKWGEVSQIPDVHSFIVIKKKIYKTHEKSETAFIIEYEEKDIHDFYFQSPKQLDNMYLRKEIISFLWLLK